MFKIQQIICFYCDFYPRKSIKWSLKKKRLPLKYHHHLVFVGWLSLGFSFFLLLRFIHLSDWSDKVNVQGCLMNVIFNGFIQIDYRTIDRSIDRRILSIFLECLCTIAWIDISVTVVHNICHWFTNEQHTLRKLTHPGGHIPSMCTFVWLYICRLFCIVVIDLHHAVLQERKQIAYILFYSFNWPEWVL